MPKEIHEHTYARIPSAPFTLSQQYADDIGWISTAKCRTDSIKKLVPPKLKERNLNVNEGKTEEYTISRTGNEEWKKCKYVGSHPDTETDFMRRKKLSVAAYQQHRKILESSRISLKIRMRLFNAYITSVFMYNVEIWSLNKTLENRIDRFHRNHLRKLLKIRWLHRISNV